MVSNEGVSLVLIFIYLNADVLNDAASVAGMLGGSCGSDGSCKTDILADQVEHT